MRPIWTLLVETRWKEGICQCALSSPNPPVVFHRKPHSWDVLQALCLLSLKFSGSIFSGGQLLDYSYFNNKKIPGWSGYHSPTSFIMSLPFKRTRAVCPSGSCLKVTCSVRYIPCPRNPAWPSRPPDPASEACPSWILSEQMLCSSPKNTQRFSKRFWKRRNSWERERGKK